jgi:hypothetical protein
MVEQQTKLAEAIGQKQDRELEIDQLKKRLDTLSQSLKEDKA